MFYEVKLILTLLIHLPLAAYKVALEKAARLLEQKNIDEASSVLTTFLNTLVVVNQTIPIPIINAKVMLKVAEQKYKKDKDTALNFINKAQNELERSKELGYTRNAEEYKDIDKSIKDLKKQIKGNENSASTFSTIKIN